MIIRMLQKGELFVTDTTDTIQGHYRTENCTKQEAPPEDKRRPPFMHHGKESLAWTPRGHP